MKCKTKQSHLGPLPTSRGPHLILGELLSITEQDALFEDLLKEHVDHMEQLKLLEKLIHQIKDNKLLSNHGNAAATSGIFTIGRYNKRGCNANGGSYCNGLQSHGGTT